MGRCSKSAALDPRPLVIFLIAVSSSNIANAQKSEPLILEHADQLVGASEGDIINLIGNVHFRHDKAHLYSNRATWYRKAGLIQFVDSVLVKEDVRQITARSMTYFRRDRRVTATENVRLVDPEQNAILTAGKVDYFRSLRQFDAYGKPKLVFNPQDDTARTLIDAERMSYFANEKRGTAIDSVVITRNDLIATSGQADFFRDPEQVILTKSPIIVQRENRLNGDSISIFTENKRLRRLLVRGNARAFYRVLPDSALEEYTTAEITGREIEAFFSEDRIEVMVTRSNATSTYDPAVTDTLISGRNLASGDSITLFFQNEIIDRVLISGGAQGEYIEPKFAGDGRPYADTTRYSAESIDYHFDSAEIQLYNNGVLRYHDMELDAGDIRYNTETKILVATGLEGGSVKSEIQEPVLKEGRDELFGRKMSYNLETRKGQVRMARTEYEGGFYTGEAIRQTSRDVLFVSEGDYTSCDKPDNPHYVLHSNRMKMMGKDKVVARPVILFIGRLPVFAVPYYVYPVKKGRTSGFLAFKIGNFERGERFISDLGYYWAASEYWDITTSLDFYENERTVINGEFRYRLRNNLRGNVGASYSRRSTWNRTQYTQRISNRWSLNFSHSQTLSPTMRLSGNGKFLSDKDYTQDVEFDPAERLNREITANLSLEEKWHDIPITIAARQTWNLDTDRLSQTLPSISFSRSSIPLIPDKSTAKKKERIRPGEEPELSAPKFYSSIKYSFGGTARNIRNRILTRDSIYVRKDYQTTNIDARIEAPQRIFGIYTVNPVFNLTHLGARIERNSSTTISIPFAINDDVIASEPFDTSHQFSITEDTLGLVPFKYVTQVSYSLGVNTGTNIYGTFYPNVFGVTGIRHTLTPSLNYTFSPETRKNEEYFRYVGMGGRVARRKQIIYGLTNVFSAKYAAGESERKLDLFNVGFNGSYNFAADSLRFSPLSSSIRTSAIPNFNFDLRTSHSFYEYRTNVRRPLSRLRLENISISSTINFRYQPGGKKEPGQEELNPDLAKPQIFAPKVGGAGEFGEVGLSGSIGYSYSESRQLVKSITQRITLNLSLQPTKNWIINYFCHYNPKTERIESQSVNIGRDMHCWKGEFSWVPSGLRSGYYVKISIKSIPDIKVEKAEGITPGASAGDIF
jgi:lipopolysaccharide assembly outer membrane protein LptD (OstA)